MFLEFPPTSYPLVKFITPTSYLIQIYRSFFMLAAPKIGLCLCYDYVYQHQDFIVFSLLLYKNLNHKRLGIYYLLAGFLYGISGTLISVLMRIELFSSGSRIISPENLNFYNIFITLHGLIMIFFLVMPVLFGGYGNFLIPIFQGSPEVVYPRANNFSILILFLSYFVVLLSLISEFGGGTG